MTAAAPLAPSEVEAYTTGSTRCRSRSRPNCSAITYEMRKGHAFVEFDMPVLDDERPIAHVLHTAIWRPRQLAAA